MPAERFYIDASLAGTLSLEGPEFHHLAHVMRTRVGDAIELVNGKGALAVDAEITDFAELTKKLSNDFIQGNCMNFSPPANKVR